MIEVKDLTKKYGTFEAVKGVSFEVGKGEIVGLLGPNGAGKTTIMKILTCYMFPTTGRVSIGGMDVYENFIGIRRSIGYLPESAPLYTDLNVMEYLNFICDARGLSGASRTSRIDEVIGLCGLEKVVYKTIDELSKGYRQRTGLAQAIIHSPDVFIMDEPTSGLDPNQIIEIRSLIRAIGKEKTVILSTHILQEVEALCRKVMILNEGRIVAQGTAEELARGLKSGAMIAVVIKPKDKSSDLRKSLTALATVRSISRMEELANGTVELLISTEGDETGEAIYDWAVAEGHKIFSMSPQKVSMEDIFTQLTTEGGSDHV